MADQYGDVAEKFKNHQRIRTQSYRASLLSTSIHKNNISTWGTDYT